VLFVVASAWLAWAIAKYYAEVTNAGLRRHFLTGALART